MMMMMAVFSCSRLALVHAVGEKREASGAGHSKVAGAYRKVLPPGKFITAA